MRKGIDSPGHPVVRISEGHFALHVPTFAEAVETGPGILGFGRVLSRKHGESAGYKIYAIPPILIEIGLHNGDALMAVNGLTLGWFEKDLLNFDLLRAEKKMTVEIVRDTTIVKRTYDLVEGALGDLSSRREWEPSVSSLDADVAEAFEKGDFFDACNEAPICLVAIDPWIDAEGTDAAVGFDVAVEIFFDPMA